MKYVKLGSTGLDVSRLCLGCMTFGDPDAGMHLALAWVLAKRGVSAPIVGASKATQLDDAIAALELVLSEEEVKHLEAPYVPHAVTGFS